MSFILHILNIFFIQKTSLLQVFIVLLAYYGAKIFIYKYCWLLLFIDYIVFPTSSAQDLVTSTNAASKSTTSIVKILPSPFMVYGEKLENI